MRGPRTAMKSSPRLPQLQETLAQKRRPNIVMNQSINKSLKKKSLQIKKKKKVLFSDLVCIKTNIIQTRLYFLILTLKEIRTFLWAPKSTMDPGHRAHGAYSISQPRAHQSHETHQHLGSSKESKKEWPMW